MEEDNTEIVPLYICGEYSYYIDMDKFNSTIIDISTKSPNPEQQSPMVFDMFRNFVDIVIETFGDVGEEYDEKLGSDNFFEKQNPSFKIAYNTLKMYNILKEAD